MKYLVYFITDKQIVLLEEEEVMLGNYESFSLEDWKSHPMNEIVHLKATYDDEIYDAALLQVWPDECTDTSVDLIKKLRSLVQLKKFTARKLASLFSSIVHSDSRQKMKPIDVSFPRLILSCVLNLRHHL